MTRQEKEMTLFVAFFLIMAIFAAAIFLKIQRDDSVSAALDKQEKISMGEVNATSLMPTLLVFKQDNNLAFVAQECNFKEEDLMTYAIYKIAKRLSFDNEVIVNQRKALLWGLK